MIIDRRRRVVLLVGRVRVLVLRVSGWWWIILGGGRARGGVVGDARTTEDRFVGCESLIRLSWTKWSVHHEGRENVNRWEAERTMEILWG
jgi:hypothetical protein